MIRGTPVTLSVLSGVSMIVGGVVIVVLSGSHASTTYDSKHLMYLYRDNYEYQAFLVIAGGAAVVLR